MKTTLGVTRHGPTPSESLIGQYNMDEVTILETENGLIILGYKAYEGKKLSYAEFFATLVKAKVLDPISQDFAYLPNGIYTTLLKNGAYPLPQGSKGGDGIFGYYVDFDPDRAQEEILDALRGDAWTSESTDVSGRNTAGPGSVLVLFGRFH